MVSSVLARHAMASDKRLFRSNYAFFNQKSLTRFVGHYIALNEKVSSMPRLPAAAPKNPFKHSAAFDYHAEKRALDAQIQRLIHSIAETAAASTAIYLIFQFTLNTPRFRPSNGEMRTGA